MVGPTTDRITDRLPAGAGKPVAGEQAAARFPRRRGSRLTPKEARTTRKHMPRLADDERSMLADVFNEVEMDLEGAVKIGDLRERLVRMPDLQEADRDRVCNAIEAAIQQRVDGDLDEDGGGSRQVDEDTHRVTLFEFIDAMETGWGDGPHTFDLLMARFNLDSLRKELSKVGTLGGLGDMASTAVMATLDAAKEEMKQDMETVQKKIESETIEKEDWALGRLLDYVNMAIRDAVIDDDMPTFVSEAVKYYIESMWGEIKGNILKGTKKNIRRNVFKRESFLFGSNTMFADDKEHLIVEPNSRWCKCFQKKPVSCIKRKGVRIPVTWVKTSSALHTKEAEQKAERADKERADKVGGGNRGEDVNMAPRKTLPDDDVNKKDAVFTDFDEGVTELSVSKSGDGTTDHPPQYTLERRLKYENDAPSYKAGEHLITFPGTFQNTNGLKLQWTCTPDMLEAAVEDARTGSKLTVTEAGEQVILSLPCGCDVGQSSAGAHGYCEIHCVKFHNPPLQVYKAAAGVRGPVMLNDGSVFLNPECQPVQSINSEKVPMRTTWTGWILYAIQPYNRGIFWQLRHPPWYLITFIGMLPLYGSNAVWWLFLYYIWDKQNDFMLCMYITYFKGVQFFSTGVFSALLASYHYYHCVNDGPDRLRSERSTYNVGFTGKMTIDGHGVDGEASLNISTALNGTLSAFMHSCSFDGPAANDVVRSSVEIVFFVAQITVVYTAFWQLNRLYFDKKRQETRGESTQPAASTTGACGFCKSDQDSRFGIWSLRNWVYWDVAVFLILLGLYAFSAPSLEQPWQRQALLYMLRMVYGLSSFPFVFWKVPGHLHVFTKTKEKGYRLDGTTADRQMRKKKEMIERAEWAFEDEVEKTQRAWNCFHLCKKQWYTADDYKNIKGSVRFHTDKLLTVQRQEDGWDGAHSEDFPEGGSPRISLDEWADWEGDSWLDSETSGGSSKFLL